MTGTVRTFPTMVSPEKKAKRTDDGFQRIQGAKILLAIHNPNNLALLRDQLNSDFQLYESPSDIGHIDFDLAIIDTQSYEQYQHALQDKKDRCEPTLLPVMLMLPKRDLKHNLRPYLALVDEFITMPVDKVEFMERVVMLLRARFLAVDQRDKLYYLATHDRVTGLANEQRCLEHVTDTILAASVLNKTVYVIVFSINLEQVFKSFGHSGLDQSAVICSQRALNTLTEHDKLFRLTTDTWCLVTTPSHNNLTHTLFVCQQLVNAMNEPVRIEHDLIHLDTAIGVSSYPDDAVNTRQVLDAAINAIDPTQTSVPNFYSKGLQKDALRYIRTETLLRQAIGKEQFELWYQPQIDFASGEVKSVEALVRWRLPNGNLVSPGDFIPIAEKTGLITQIDRWVIMEACETMARWKEQALSIERVAVNVTACDVEEDDFVSFIDDILKKNHIPPPNLELEITEGVFFHSKSQNLEKLSLLRKRGISIAVDDFGTGYSSLSYLHTLPISTLKIDRSFINSILTSENDVAITESILWLAKTFKLQTVAEGIETVEQAGYLKKLGVNIAQGFYYAKPMPEAQFLVWLANHQNAERVEQRQSEIS
ncbi:bifunctional diguanylate cyclase/phosphodiesterase [Salinivibrio kushneri]|uniref:Bifunctional diguanylate cyclase/phosphodiesterase n=1 Tax=Salinivibrio kushneri TaxID=1908198 RepID=A0AA47LR21_9GAMM|nr:bifunctional diguanylate cyclase/phosphodiesterase [Salinivibrio kushneri]WBA07757.1 bifunctional diguanylate cyclase/phosphodiesterase [Salinivibrio kushneri]